MGAAQPIEYDKNKRMKFHPDFHGNQGKPFSEEDLEYLCRFYEIDGLLTTSMALERTQVSIADKVHKLKRDIHPELKISMYEFYKNSDDYWL